MTRIAKLPARLVWILTLGVLAACSERASPPTPTTGDAAPAASGVTVFSGARLIVGDGNVIDNATFTVGPDNRFAIVGATAAVTVPAGATTVDLSGLTVMPAIVDTHTHLSRDRAGLLADLKHRAYFGVSAAMSLGQDNTDDAYVMRREVIPGHALYRMAGRGFTAPEPGRTDIPYWITTPEEGRAGVREQAARGVDIIKVWVDDRNGQYPKLAPELYGAVIDEAHKTGLRTTAHEYYLADAKALVRAGIDAFAHGVRDTDVDDELVALLKERPSFVVVPNLPDRGVVQDMSWLSGHLPAEQVATLQAAATDRPEAQAFFAIQARNLARLSREGVKIALGTDGNVPWGAHLEMADMVASGMTPAEVVIASTRNAAEFMLLTDAGTVAPGKAASFIV
ncbi:MAG TPA: amidohydrolase family protein, partial [Gammaproteobacteria bacterium]|nr:amidohydrolase family protein [Gammaproteobacteria bacterium]